MTIACNGATAVKLVVRISRGLSPKTTALHNCQNWFPRFATIEAVANRAQHVAEAPSFYYGLLLTGRDPSGMTHDAYLAVEILELLACQAFDGSCRRYKHAPLHQQGAT